MTDPYDDQVELDEFRQHLSTMAAYYKRAVAERCADRLRRDFAEAAKPAVSRRTRLLQTGKRVLEKLIRTAPLAGEEHEGIPFPQPPSGTVIDADYRVIDSSTVSSSPERSTVP